MFFFHSFSYWRVGYRIRFSEKVAYLISYKFLAAVSENASRKDDAS